MGIYRGIIIRFGTCIGVVVGLTLALLACLGQFDPASLDAAVPTASRNVDITIRDFFFDPPVVTVPVASSVTWTHMGVFSHTTHSDTGIWQSAPLGTGDVFSRTFDTTGTFPYHCDLHPSLMTGIIVVVRPLWVPAVLRQP